MTIKNVIINIFDFNEKPGFQSSKRAFFAIFCKFPTFMHVNITRNLEEWSAGARPGV